MHCIPTGPFCGARRASDRKSGLCPELFADGVRISAKEIESVEEHLREVLPGQADGGQGREDHIAELNVVKAYDGEVFRRREVGLVQNAERTDGGKVVRSEDGRRTIFESEELSHGSLASTDPVVAGTDELRIDGEFGRAHRRLEGGEAMIGDGQPGGSADVADLFVTELLEMFDCELHAAQVIDGHVAETGVQLSSIHGHQRHAMVKQGLDGLGLDLGCEKGDPIYFANQHAMDGSLHL